MARRGHERAEGAAAAPRVGGEVILETIFAKPTGWLLPHPPWRTWSSCRGTGGSTRTGGAADLRRIKTRGVGRARRAHGRALGLPRSSSPPPPAASEPCRCSVRRTAVAISALI